MCIHNRTCNYATFIFQVTVIVIHQLTHYYMMMTYYNMIKVLIVIYTLLLELVYTRLNFELYIIMLKQNYYVHVS